MGKLRFEKPDVVRLQLSEGDWVEIRKRLSAGQSRRMHSAAFDKLEGKGVTVDFAMLGLARTLAYLVDWSFRDENDKPVKCTPAAIEALTVEDLKEIEVALDKYLELQQEEKAKEKTTENTSSPA